MEANEHPERSKELGVLFISDTTWAGNSKTIAKNCGMKKDTFTHSLLNHGFRTDTAVPFCKEVAALGNIQCVHLYSHPLISRSTLATDIEALRKFGRAAKDRDSVEEKLFPPLTGTAPPVDGGEVSVPKPEEGEEYIDPLESFYDLGEELMRPIIFNREWMTGMDSPGHRPDKGECSFVFQDSDTDSSMDTLIPKTPEASFSPK
jgi:hypothetical protein